MSNDQHVCREIARATLQQLSFDRRGDGIAVGGFLPPASASPISKTRVGPRSNRTTRLFSLGLPASLPLAWRIVMLALWSNVMGVPVVMRLERLSVTVVAGSCASHSFGPNA